MKVETFSGTIENAYGSKLPKDVKFNGSFDSYETIDEIRAANDLPSNDDIISFVNSKRKANARQKAMTAALDAAGIAKPTLENPAEQYKQMVKILVTAGKSEAEAAKIAAATLNYKAA